MLYTELYYVNVCLNKKMKVESKMKKRFGIDIDGTVTSPASLIPFLNDAFGTNIKYEDITQYELTPFVNVTEDELAKWFETS